MILFGLLVIGGFLFLAYYSVRITDTGGQRSTFGSRFGQTSPGSRRVGRYLPLGYRAPKQRRPKGFPQY